MAYPERQFRNDGIFHIYNRGVEKRITFMDYFDYRRFLETLLYYQQRTEELKKFTRAKINLTNRERPFRFELLAYCIMPNHFHLLVRQVLDDGISSAMGQLLNSYTKYFNTKHNRVGHLFQGRFQAVPAADDEQLIHVTRYILLNPYVAGLTADPLTYPFSSIRETIGHDPVRWCDTQFLRNYFQGPAAIQSFITDYADEARTRVSIQINFDEDQP